MNSFDLQLSASFMSTSHGMHAQIQFEMKISLCKTIAPIISARNPTFGRETRESKLLGAKYVRVQTRFYQLVVGFFELMTNIFCLQRFYRIY